MGISGKPDTVWRCLMNLVILCRYSSCKHKYQNNHQHTIKPQQWSHAQFSFPRGQFFTSPSYYTILHKITRSNNILYFITVQYNINLYNTTYNNYDMFLGLIPGLFLQWQKQKRNRDAKMPWQSVIQKMLNFFIIC